MELLNKTNEKNKNMTGRKETTGCHWNLFRTIYKRYIVYDTENKFVDSILVKQNLKTKKRFETEK